jgi:hypothetical protein
VVDDIVLAGVPATNSPSVQTLSQEMSLSSNGVNEITLTNGEYALLVVDADERQEPGNVLVSGPASCFSSFRPRNLGGEERPGWL